MEAFVLELLEIGEEFEQDEDAHLFFNALQRMISDGMFVVFEEEPDLSDEFVRLCEFVRLVCPLSVCTTTNPHTLVISKESKATFETCVD